jgi:DNA-binding winged helix-turn-helix (wHTH) protein
MDEGATADVFLFEAFRLDRRAGALFRRDDKGAAIPVAIGSRGLAVLAILMARHGDLVSKDEIMQAVWPETVVEDNNLTVQISALRRVLDQGRAGGSCIQTIAGRGYRFLGRLVRDGGDPRPRLSIVVLPFANLSGDSRQQFFCRCDHRRRDDGSIASRRHVRDLA